MIELVWLPLDNWIVAIGILTAMACALPGCFLLLRGQAMLGDAIAHAVLPGIALSYLLFGSTDPILMLAGAAGVGILTAFLVQVLHRVGGVEEGAAMGVVFTSLFALGLVMVRRAADDAHLDAEHVIFGAIELAPAFTVSIGPLEVPRALLAAAVMLLVNGLFIAVFFKELRLSIFDPSFAHTAGWRPGLVHYALIALTASTMVAAFEAVGSILVLAMLIVPGALARLLTNRLLPMLVVSLVAAAVCAAVGHLSAITLPQLAGFEDASSSGMIAAVSGVLFLGVLFLAPGNGIVARAIGRFRDGVKIVSEDILGALYRARELTGDEGAGVDREHLAGLLGGGITLRLSLFRLLRSGRIRREAGMYILNARGERAARRLVRRHRLWETWLVEELGLRPDHVHNTAERLEHITTAQMSKNLSLATHGHETDPHDKAIPAMENGGEETRDE